MECLLPAYRGQAEGGLAESELARELDPLSLIKTVLVAAGLEAQGDDAAALRLIQRALELDPSNSALHYRLSDLLNRQGHTTEAAAEWRTGLKLDGDFQVLSRFDSTLRRSDISAAKRAVARMFIERRLEQAKHQYVFPRVLVELYLQAGDERIAYGGSQKLLTNTLVSWSR